VKKHLIAITILIVGTVSFYLFYLKQQIPIKPVKIEPLSNVAGSSGPNINIQNESVGVKGSISGKLCYPSEYLPSGLIVAKDIKTEKEYSMHFVGNKNVGKTTYTFELQKGTYYVKYVPQAENTDTTLSPGYFTNQCPTGMETECNEKNKRTNREVTVVPNITIKGVDLCDFYYSKENEPVF
jgi:hypothetical protein